MKSDSKKRILLVEDDSFVAMMGMRTLTINNFDVVHVNSGEKAIELIDSDPYFDMVLMDIDLGIGMEGTDAAKIILERHDVPLVFLSSHTEPEIVKKTEDITSFGYIVKDSGETVLIASIKMAFKLFDSIKKERLKEQELVKSEERYLALFEDNSIGMAVYEALDDGNTFIIKAFNKEAEEITEKNKKDVIDKDIREVFPNVDRYGLLKILKQVWETGKPIYKNADLYEDETLFKYIDNYIYKLPSGEIVGCFTDFTQQKKLEVAYHESEERFRVLHDASLSGIFIHDKGLILECNQAICDITGYSYEELIGKNSFSLFTEKDREIAYQHSTELYEEPYEVTALRKNGEKYDVMLLGKKIPYNGKILRAVEYRDISEFKKIARQLKESDYNYKQLFSNMMSAFAIHELVYDKNGEAVDYRFVEVNPFFEEITGLVAKEIIGKTVLEVLPNTESYWIEYYAKVVKTGKTFNFSQYSQGLGKYYDVLAFPIGEKGFATIFNDVTEHKIISDTQEFIINTFHNAEENFFEALARFLSELFGVSCVMIGKYSNGYVDTLAMHFNGESHAKISYPVKNMPCQKVIEQHICYYQHSVCEHYPSCEMLQQIGAESFLGISLISKSGSPIGLISLIDTKPLIKESIHEKVLRVVSVRTTEEIERETNDELIHNLLQTNELQLKESHHRMKNNMNTMYSLLMIKADEHKGTDAEEILIDSAKYLSSMRILYDNLFYYNTFSKLDLKLFVHGLVHDILQANYIKVQIHSNFDVDEIELIPDVLSSLGLIINELISNSIKHGFQDDGENHIWLSAKEIEDKLVIKFKNSGLKLPDDFDLSSSKGFGMQLISALVSQHKGVFYNLSGNRTEFVIEIPLRDIKK